jgi:signal transduction histidine kinase/phage shock protein PspC (stress-responsive transcriptional regulator)
MCHHQGMDLPRQASPDVERPAGVVAGVAADVARRLGLDPVVVRMALVVLTLAGGAGVLLYAVLWLRQSRLGPSGAPVPPAAAAPPPDATGRLGLAVMFLGVLLTLRALGLWFGDALVIPVALGAVGSVLIWSQSDASGRARLVRVLRLPGRPALHAPPGRLLGGIVLVAVAMVGLLVANDALVAVRELGVAILAATVGLALLFGPWAIGLVEAVGLERRARIREEERGEIAAHLHDSVLQSLALIQRASDDPQRMAAIARRQERELRRWLFEGRSDEDASTLSGALAAAAAALEDAHGITVELVRVGEASLTPALAALVAAVREAVGNAARHAGVATVSVFVEVSDDEVVAFVRDRGRGFDAGLVAEDRSGIRHSIRRAARASGRPCGAHHRAGRWVRVGARRPSLARAGGRARGRAGRRRR